MKTLKNLLFLCSLAVLTACSDDAFVPQSEVIPATGSGSVDYISMTVPDIEIDDATTRSKLIDDGTELKFVWQEKDAIGVVPMNGLPLKFPIHAENAQKNTAVFDGGDWALKTSTKYAAFFPYNKNIAEKDIRHIPIDYRGQTQSNYMKYDFMATGAIQPKDGAVNFTMQRLSAIIKIRTFIGADNRVQYCSLTAKDPVFGIKGTLDLSGTKPVYTPEIMSKSINLNLEVNKVSSGEYFTFYVMIPPTNLSGKTLKFIMNNNSGAAKEVEIEGKNFEAGKAYYAFAGAAQDSYITNENLIAAAGLTDVVVENKGVNVWSQRERIMQVTWINVAEKNDPTVCDEIGFFRNLKTLYCNSNQLTSLDVSNNTALTRLDCYRNQLTSLDVSNNTALTRLDCYSNQLTSLDVSNNTALTHLYCYRNQLTSLDVSNNTALITLSCHNNQLTSLDVSNNTALTQLDCYSNQLTSLDVSNNTALITLSCHNNQLTSLDVSNNTDLARLDCHNNQLTSLDVSNNTALTYLWCYSNQLTSLSITNLPKLELLNVTDNKQLTTLYCSFNALTTLNVSGCSALATLHCPNNYLKTLDISSCTALTELYCYKNLMSALDITKCTSLTKSKVRCGGQYEDEEKTTYKTLTLTARATDTTELLFTQQAMGNLNVTVVNQ